MPISVSDPNQLITKEPELLPETPAPNLQRKKIITIIVIILFVILGSGVTYYFLAPKTALPKKIAQAVIEKTAQTVVPEPTPMPFADLTIPYLRKKTFSSELGEQTRAYDGSTYTAYTTNYTSEGLKINGLLTKPNGEAPALGWPAIVFVHGYIPPNTYETTGEAYSSYVDFLASKGYVVFKVDLRGHGNSEGEPGGAYYSSDYVIDVLNAYSALENTSFVDPKKIGLWGHSMAGNVTLRSWAVKKTIPAVVIWAGAGYTYEDLVKYRITDSSFQPQQNNIQRLRRRQQIYEQYGSPSAHVKFWQEVAPTSYLNELRGAIQIHHAIDDDVVSVAYSRELNQLFEEKTLVYHEFYEYISGGHNISGASFNEAMQRTADFYTKRLQ